MSEIRKGAVLNHLPVIYTHIGLCLPIPGPAIYPSG